jgi:CRP/FNR family cyclic AMP-dependent transcriptional regulator
MIMTDIDFLDKVQIFQGLDRKQLAAVIKYCVEAEFQPGTRIFEQGEDAHFLWIVKEGRVDLRFEVAGRTSSPEKTISSIPETGAFGWSSFTSPHKYRLSGYCTGQSCKFIKVERDGLRQLFEEDPDIGYVVMSNVAAVVGTRFNEFQEEAARHRGQDLLGGW